MLIQFCLDYLKSNLLAELHLHNLQNSEHNFDGFMFVFVFFTFCQTWLWIMGIN